MCTSCGKPLSIGLISNAAEIYPELVRRGVIPDLVTDQASAHDALNGYISAGLSLECKRAYKSRPYDMNYFIILLNASTYCVAKGLPQ